MVSPPPPRDSLPYRSHRPTHPPAIRRIGGTHEGKISVTALFGSSEEGTLASKIAEAVETLGVADDLADIVEDGNSSWTSRFARVASQLGTPLLEGALPPPPPLLPPLRIPTSFLISHPLAAAQHGQTPPTSSTPSSKKGTSTAPATSTRRSSGKFWSRLAFPTHSPSRT